MTNLLALPPSSSCSAGLQIRTNRLDNYSDALLSSLIVHKWGGMVEMLPLML